MLISFVQNGASIGVSGYTSGVPAGVYITSSTFTMLNATILLTGAQPRSRYPKRKALARPRQAKGLRETRGPPQRKTMKVATPAAKVATAVSLFVTNHLARLGKNGGRCRIRTCDPLIKSYMPLAVIRIHATHFV